MASIYRSFHKQWSYFDRHFNNCVYQMPKIFPPNGNRNLCIVINGPGTGLRFSALMTNALPEYAMHSNGLCLPRFLYDDEEAVYDEEQGSLLTSSQAAENSGNRHDGLTDQGLAHFQAAYRDEAISKNDLFHYVYGLLHSEEYRDRFADNLSKELPRIPVVKEAADFWNFVEAGRKLSDLHCDFEQAELHPVVFTRGDTSLAAPANPETFYRVEQMKFAGKRPNLDKSTVIYNANITISGIPQQAYDYVVNGKPALEWVMERQSVKADKASGDLPP